MTHNTEKNFVTQNQFMLHAMPYILRATKNQKGGTALIMTMMVLSSILFIVLATSDVVRNGLIASKSQVNSAKAYYAAESGAERILWEIRKNRIFDTVTCNDGDVFCFDFGAGPSPDPYSVIVDCDSTCGANENREQTLLDGKAVYTIDYETNTAPDPPNEITSTGTYIDPKDSTARLSRIIKIYY